MGGIARDVRVGSEDGNIIQVRGGGAAPTTRRKCPRGWSFGPARADFFVVVVWKVINFAEHADQLEHFLAAEKFAECGVDGLAFGFEAEGLHRFGEGSGG